MGLKIEADRLLVLCEKKICGKLRDRKKEKSEKKKKRPTYAAQTMCWMCGKKMRIKLDIACVKDTTGSRLFNKTLDHCIKH